MKCNCIEETNKKLREKFGDPDARLCTCLGFVGNKAISYIPIEFSVRKKKANGEFNRRETTMSITATYCPFCGTKCQED